MKILRFFLSNLILITFFCAIIYAYYYWDNLTGEDTPAAQAVAYLSKEFKVVGAFIEGVKSKQSGVQEPVAESIPIIATIEKTVNETPVVQAPVIQTPAVQTRVSRVQEDVFVTPQIEQSLDRAVSQQVDKQSVISTIVTESNTEEDSNRALWIDARKAFYKRNYASSITSYRRLIANSNDNYDAYGELGNVYFNQGKKVEAATAYYEAASLLVKLGYARRADSLIPVLNYLDAEKAGQLKELMATSQS